MRLSVLMTVYNEADFVEYAIRSCLPYVDDLVIVEGAYQETIALGASPRSTDGTVEKIKKAIGCTLTDEEFGHKYFQLRSEQADVYYLEANEQTDKDQRNVGLEKIKKLNPNGWLLIVDGDEVWTESDLRIVKNFAKLYDRQNTEDVRVVYFQSLTFVDDFQHFCLQKFPRLFKITPECQFVNDNYMQYGGLSLFGNHIIENLNVKYHHFAFCKGLNRFMTKVNWWNSRFGEDSNFEYGWYIGKDGKINSPNHKIYKYKGKLPEILKEHLLWKKDTK